MSAAQQSEITTAIEKITEGRQTINHVCGMLMFVYGIDADAALQVLKWRSQQTNVKVRILAERFVVEAAALSRTAGTPDTACVDHLLMTVHERVPLDAASETASPENDSVSMQRRRGNDRV